MSRDEHLDVTIASDITAGQEVQERILAIVERLEFPARDVFGIRLSLEEALVNAIKHGNGEDPDKKVRVECTMGAAGIRIVIEDEGNGFVPEEVPDPTAEENLDRPSGRGIMLMKSFMDVVEYNERGNRVLIEKQRSSEDE